MGVKGIFIQIKNKLMQDEHERQALRALKIDRKELELQRLQEDNKNLQREVDLRRAITQEKNKKLQLKMSPIRDIGKHPFVQNIMSNMKERTEKLKTPQENKGFDLAITRQMKKGITPITVFFWVVGLVAVWWAIAPIMNTFAQQGIADNNVTGVGAFILTNMNFIIFIIILIFILAIQFWGNQ